MSNPSATAGDKTTSTSSKSPGTTQQQTGQQQTGRSELKPPITMTYNNEKLEATGVKPLEAPGESSNYHYWQFVIGTVIRGSSFGYVIRDVQPNPLPASNEHD
ncbi:uncharacterized protein MELLADRAFT_65608 [Melampsora larici-populina 98AG31]|uniref:Uncharacterized protein n=1 Tax=Melampsora larici-populina (strain 98AG31 / pathotype 3-4-7) TaxID=747676 RepID=F4RW23_MELLP|nr:uncharacterized protein MELLADRAFT_65608 [Melampsora larici-populina 98AG31]EGG03461.1 hypothetical protein MELLADRAFT_65608 [Melampsora larici-populina 98AG31]